MQKPLPFGPPPKAALAFILAVVLLDTIALGIVIPVLPRLVENMAGGDTATAARERRQHEHWPPPIAVG